MQAVQSNIFIDRDDTFFGVCEALGEDLGFHANWLRVGLALMLFFNPLAAVAAYAGAGVVVAFTRWIAPNPASPEAPEAAEAEAARAEPAEALAIAA